MGFCGSKLKEKSHICSRLTHVQVLMFEKKFDKIELHLLALIYEDLAMRSKSQKISRETFSDYFNMIGLWGERVFDKFNKKHDEQITYEEFVGGIEFYIKGTEQDKINNLFQLYDLHQLGGIKKEDFLQMLYNYPKPELKKILDDQQFLEYGGILSQYNQQEQKRSKKLRPRKGSEDVLQETCIPSNKLLVNQIRKNSKNMESMMIVEPKSASMEFDVQLNKQSQSNQSKLPEHPQTQHGQYEFQISRDVRQQSIDMMFPSESMVGTNGVPLGGFGCNLSFRVDGNRIELKMANINVLVKKYVDNVYQLKTKEDELLSLQDFTTFVKNHPNLLNSLYKGFHYNLWGIDREKQPLFKFWTTEVSGVLKKISRKDNKQTHDRYCELHEHFFLEFHKTSQSMPHKIRCLDGLTVLEQTDLQAETYGFQIHHKDKIYKQKSYLVKDLDNFKLWSQALQIYQKSEIQEHYSIQQKIGEGKFSTVYKCQQKETKNFFALKVIERFKLSKEEKRLLAHETEIMKLLNHSCIVKFQETIENKSHIYIVTELVQDGDLFDYIMKKVHLSEYEASLIMSQLLDAIEYIHSIGIVHRDLKPENIMIVLEQSHREIKQVKIIDFGFANFLKNLNDDSGDKGLCGTPNYLAPESLAFNKIGFKADNFALGVIMYFMLSGTQVIWVLIIKPFFFPMIRFPAIRCRAA